MHQGEPANGKAEENLLLLLVDKGRPDTGPLGPEARPRAALGQLTSPSRRAAVRQCRSFRHFPGRSESGHSKAQPVAMDDGLRILECKSFCLIRSSSANIKALVS